MLRDPVTPNQVAGIPEATGHPEGSDAGFFARNSPIRRCPCGGLQPLTPTHATATFSGTRLTSIISNQARETISALSQTRRRGDAVQGLLSGIVRFSPPLFRFGWRRGPKRLRLSLRSDPDLGADGGCCREGIASAIIVAPIYCREGLR
jgi:hypothetical protein